MLKIEFVVGLDGPAQLDQATGVVTIDYLKWTKMEKQPRQFVLEHFRDLHASHQRWVAERENRAADSEEQSMREYAEAPKMGEDDGDDVRWDIMFTCNTHASCVEDAVKIALEQIADRSALVEIDRDGCSYDEGPLSEYIGDSKAADTARMSVPDSDDDFDWNMGVPLDMAAVAAAYQLINERMSVPDSDEEDTRPPKAKPAVEDHFIRAYNTETHEVVYWQEKWGWGTDRTKMRYFTRSKALELANSTNAMDDNDEIINVCAIQEIR